MVSIVSHLYSHFSCAKVSTFSVLRFTHTPGVTYTREEGNH